jgi:diacylglycerol kinase (ATP)
MKHLFILNPASFRSKKKKDLLLKKLTHTCQNLNYEIYFSQSAEDAKAKAVSEAENGAEICIYVGGGDGSIHQIAEAIYRYPNVILSVIPIGTGNDFIRSFGTKEDFLSLNHITDGITRTIDLIRVGNTICVNMINIGFDESVVRKVSQLRRFPFMTSAVAYTIGVIIQLIRFPHESLTITYDDQSEYNGTFLLTYIANGKYCGGGYKAASLAEPDDGKMDVLTVYPVSRRTFLSLVGAYKKGTLLNRPDVQRISEFRQVKQLTLSKEQPFYICIDGEIRSVRQLKAEVLPQALRIKVPQPRTINKTDT